MTDYLTNIGVVDAIHCQAAVYYNKLLAYYSPSHTTIYTTSRKRMATEGEKNIKIERLNPYL